MSMHRGEVRWFQVTHQELHQSSCLVDTSNELVLLEKLCQFCSTVRVVGACSQQAAVCGVSTHVVSTFETCM